MVDFNLRDLADLVGPASAFTLSAGLICGTLSYIVCKGLKAQPDHNNGLRLIYSLPLGWGILAIFLMFRGLATAYSGPPEGRILREPRLFDTRFATEIAFAFGLVFAFDALRLKPLRKRPDAWVILAFYLLVALCRVVGRLR
ncbi:MAG: hypothetical protein JWM16_4607 [Verrucomicrobiales bacterium]|nr:hypothetical protein [Verrucomicrobiales bacterium]